MRDRLPGLLAEIADIAGVDAAMAVARAKGGTVARFASRLSPENWLVQAVGMETAQRIADAITSGKGIDLLVPLGPTGSFKRDQRARAEAYTRALASGANISQTARQVGVTRRSVERFRLRMQERDPDQGDLF